MDYIKAFIIGGLICLIGQIIIDITKLPPAYILIVFVVLGALLSAFGLYQPLVNIGEAGAMIPITGFGHSLVTGVMEDVDKFGFLGVFTGGLRAGAAGITVAVVFGYLMAVLFNPKSK